MMQSIFPGKRTKKSNLIQDEAGGPISGNLGSSNTKWKEIKQDKVLRKLNNMKLGLILTKSGLRMTKEMGVS